MMMPLYNKKNKDSRKWNKVLRIINLLSHYAIMEYHNYLNKNKLIKMMIILLKF